jgi:hypothetical protein
MWHNASSTSAQDWISITASGHNSGQQQRHEPHQRLGNIFDSVHFDSPLLSDPEYIGAIGRIFSGTCPDVLHQYSLMKCCTIM